MDSQGNRIPDGKGGWKNHQEDTTDWNNRENAEKWRAAWAAYANRALEVAGRPERIDHRSYERQGVEKIPTIHMGVAASQMEHRGIATEKGNINRAIADPGRREATPQSVEELARSIAAVGLMNPVTLDQNNTLIAGLHRLEAAKLLGWTEIECNITSMNGVQAELAEIDENIVRTKLTKQELGDQLLRRKELYEMLHPETRQV